MQAQQLQQEPPPTLDQTGTVWRDDTWLAAGHLHPAHALPYFCRSVFFDPESNNARAARLNVPLEKLDNRSPGVEYAVADQQAPHLYVIRKLWRPADPSGEPSDLAYYYILDGSVYQAPSVHAALASRMQRCLYGVRGALEDLRADLDPLSRGAEAAEESALDREIAAGREAPKRQGAEDRERARRVEANLRHVLAEFAMPVPLAALQEPMAAVVPTTAAEQQQRGSVPPGAPSGLASHAAQ